MSRTIQIKVSSDSGMRVDKYLSINSDNQLSRSAASRLIEEGEVLINGKIALKSTSVKIGDEIIAEIREHEKTETFAENIPLDIVYEDDNILVVNVPKAMVVHPAVGNESGTLVNALLYHCGDCLSRINGDTRPGIVHRIDKDTSGLLIVAKNDYSHIKLAEQIKEHSFKRIYEAVVYGNVKQDFATIETYIGRHPKDRKKMAVTQKNSREAITHFEVIQRYGNFTHLRLQLETGRTHQIRVHMAHLGHPVAGDAVYGPKKIIKQLKGQCLHAKTIGFIHPTTNQYLEFDSELPEYFSKFLRKIEDATL